MTKQQIEGIKTNANQLSGESKVKYLRGVRDGLDLASLIAEDNKFPLAGISEFQEFLDYLDEEV